jgi:hypothetical protein
MVLSTLIRTFLSEELQYDETPEGAKKRNKLKAVILEMTKDQLPVGIEYNIV